MRRLILASVSPRRRALLRVFGLPFRVIEPRVTEVHDHRLTPRRLVALNARLKAQAVAASVRHGVIIAADTLVVLGRRYLGKPRNTPEAARMLRALQGRAHRVYTGVCVMDIDRGRRWQDVSVTRVAMRRLSDRQIAAYLRRLHVLDKAGAYAVQDVQEMVIDTLQGSLSNVIGLPLDIVERRLRQCRML